jgi:hypothetical protein
MFKSQLALRTVVEADHLLFRELRRIIEDRTLTLRISPKRLGRLNYTIV